MASEISWFSVMVEVVYVCSKDYWRHLFLSMRTLFESGTYFDRVRVIVTSEQNLGWNFKTDRIVIDNTKDIGEGFWMLNKTQLGRSDADVVIFLDTDTVILNPIDEIYSGCDSDIIARKAPSVQTKYFYPEKWKKTLNYYGCDNYPYLSSGFVIFQNNSQKRINKKWIKITNRLLNGEGVNKVTRHANQQAFSISACIQDLSVSLMEEHHHSYAMIGEDYKGSVVHHLGTPNFYYYYLDIEKEMGLGSKDLPVKRPRLLWLHRLKNRLSRKIKIKLGLDRKSFWLK